jgi:hypothetical protein
MEEGTMNMRFKIMDSSGHTTKEFSTADKTRAMRTFARLIDDKKMLAYVPEKDGKHRQIKSLDGLAPNTEIVFTPPLQAG